MRDIAAAHREASIFVYAQHGRMHPKLWVESESVIVLIEPTSWDACEITDWQRAQMLCAARLSIDGIVLGRCDEVYIRDMSVPGAVKGGNLADMVDFDPSIRTALMVHAMDALTEETYLTMATFDLDNEGLPYWERHENESLTVELDRIFNICLRAGLYPDPPQEIAGEEIDIKYVSMLSTAQRAINTVPTERLLGLVGNIASVDPGVLDTVNFDELVYSYAIDIGAHPTILRDQNELRARRQAREQQAQALEATATAQTAIQGAQALSQTDVGGGANALQRILS
jgi:hypothetical protein